MKKLLPLFLALSLAEPAFAAQHSNYETTDFDTEGSRAYELNTTSPSSAIPSPGLTSNVAVNGEGNPSMDWSYPWLTGFSRAEVGDGLVVGTQLGLASGMASMMFPPGTGFETRGVGLGGLAGLHLGYGYSFHNQVYLGARAYGNFERVKYISTEQDPNTTFQIGNNYGFVFLPGYHLSPSNLVYGKLGYNRAYLNFVAGTGGSSWQNSADYGFGFKQALSDNLSLGLEYDWLYYHKPLAANTVMGISGSTTANYSQKWYLLSLDYQLGSIKDRSSHQPELRFTGPYLGFNAGVRTQALRDEWTDGNPESNDIFQANGTFESIKVGYGYQMSPWFYLGAEIFAGSAQQVEPVQFNSAFNKEKQSLGASLLPGYIIDESNLLFMRIGYIRTGFQGLVNSGNGSIYSKQANGVELGLGYEAALIQALSLVIEYDYNRYAEIKGFNPTASITNNYTIQDNMMSLGLNYRFAL